MSVGRGCLLFLASIVLLPLGEWFLLRHVHGEAIWWHAAILGVSLALLASALWGIGTTLRLLPQVMVPGAQRPRDGRRAILHGSLHPGTAAAMAPISGGTAVYVDYTVKAKTGGSGRQLGRGLAAVPCSLRAPGQSAVQVLGFPVPQDLETVHAEEGSAQRLAEYLLSSEDLLALEGSSPLHDLEGRIEQGALRRDRIAGELRQHLEAVLASLLPPGEVQSELEDVPTAVESSLSPTTAAAKADLVQFLSEQCDLEERSLPVGAEVTLIGRWRARPPAIDVGTPLRGAGRVSRRSPMRLLAGDLMTSGVGLSLFFTATVAAHLLFFPDTSSRLLERSPLPSAVTERVTGLAHQLSPLSTVVADSAPSALSQPADALDDPRLLERFGAEASGVLEEINIGTVTPRDGIAWRYRAPTRRIDPTSDEAELRRASDLEFEIGLGRTPLGVSAGELSERLVVVLSERFLASRALAETTPCAPTHVEALLRLRRSPYARLELDAEGKPLSLQVGSGKGPRATSFQIGKSPVRVRLKERDGTVSGRLWHESWGSVRFSVPLARGPATESDWSSDLAMEDEVLDALQSLRNAARARDLEAVLAALRLPSTTSEVLQEFPSFAADLEAYDELFLDPTAPVRIELEPQRARIALAGQGPQGGEFFNFAHFAACDARPVLVMMATNPR